jgi:PAS domain S-box-containing protein
MPFALAFLLTFAACVVLFIDRRSKAQELKASEQSFLDLQTRYREILSSLREGFVTLDHNYRITYINPEGLRYIGAADSDCLGKNFYDLFPETKNTAFFESVRKAMQDRIPTESLETFQSSWFEIRTYPFSEGVSLFFRDVTEKKHLEAVLEEQRAKAAMSSKMSTLGEMASGVAHEINNPLMIILTRTEQLNDMASTGRINAALVKQCAEKIHHTVMRISRIVKALRSFGRDGENDPFESATLNTIVEETLELCSEKFAFNRVQLRVTGLDDSVSLQCRPVQVSQILLNLLNNSFDAVRDATRLRWVHLDVRVEDNQIRIRVTDSGNGIIPKIRQKLFQPFYTTKEVGHGTGLGLSISRNIALAHAGSLEYDETNPNTSFVLTLPRKATTQLAA